MKVFISWSGPRGKLIATGLHTWLGDVVHKVEPWLSSEDIDPGTRWNSELAKQLEDTMFGVVCLTPESAQAPWPLFETGALAKALGSSHVVPYLVQMDARALKQPLAQFDAVEATKSGTLKLARSINRALGKDALPDDRLQRCFERFWLDMEQVIDQLPPAPSEPDALAIGAKSLGLERVFRSRSEALTYFRAAFRQEIVRSRRSVGLVHITCTSMRGFMVTDASDFNGPDLIEELIESKCTLNIMMTHPETAERRAKQEKRPPEAIAGEVRSSVSQLTSLGVSLDQIKFYRGAPTVFGIATSDMMLLNPYPLENESHRCMTLVVRKTEDTQDIFHQYFEAHFVRPWKNAVPVGDVGPQLIPQANDSMSQIGIQRRSRTTTHHNGQASIAKSLSPAD